MAKQTALPRCGGAAGDKLTYIKSDFDFGDSLMSDTPLLCCGDCFQTVDAPFLGLPGADQDVHDGRGDDRPVGETQPLVMSLADCPPWPAALPGVLDEAAQALDDVEERFRLRIPGVLDGPAAINVANQNVVIKLAVPTAGPFYPRAVFTYNSKGRLLGSPYGCRWSLLFDQKIFASGSDAATIRKGDGACWHYTDLDDATGYYLAPDSMRNSLLRTSTGWIETQPDGMELHYEELTSEGLRRGVGRLFRLQRHGQVWTLTHDDDGFVTDIEDPFGRHTTFTYVDNKLTTVTDHAGRQTLFEIEYGCLRTVTLPESCVISFTYDNRARMLSYVAPGAHTTRFTYDLCGRVETVTTPKGETATFHRVDEATTEVTDARGNLTTVTFDDHCYIAAVTNPLGHTTDYTWKGNRVSGITDANGHATELQYTTLSNRTQAVSGITYPNGDAFLFRYDANDRVEAVVNPRGHVATLSWSGYDRTGILDPLGYRVTFTYNAAGQLLTEENEEGDVTSLAYDPVGQVESRDNPLGERTTFTYNAYGQRQTVKNPEGDVFTTTYDALNRPTARISPMGDQTRFTYGANSLLASTEDPEGHVTTTLYDANRRVETVVDPLTHRTTYVYDPVGNRVAVVNPLGHIHTSVFDAANRRVEAVNPLGYVTTFGYDPADNLTSRKNPEGHTARTEYDSRDRAVVEIDALGHRTTFTYDGSNNRLSETDPEGHATHYTYDPCNRRKTVTNPEGETATLVYYSDG